MATLASPTESSYSTSKAQLPLVIRYFFSAIAQNCWFRNQLEESQQEIRQLKERVAELERSRPAGETELKGETISDCSSPSQPRSQTSSEPQPGGENQSSDRMEGEGANESRYREQYEKLLASNSELKEQIKEYQQQISLDSLNSSKPPSSDGLKKRTATVNGRPQRAGEKKPLGGQPKHQGRTLSQSAEPDQVVNLYPTVCPHCGEAIPESSEWDSKPVIRQVIDQKKDGGEIHITEYRAHRCSCPHCGQRVRASFPSGVEGPIQFGPILAAKIVYLRVAHFIPERRVAEIIRVLLNVTISPATVTNRCRRAAQRYRPVLQQFETQVAQSSETKHLDETGFRVQGKLSWLHVMSTDHSTCYRTHEKRGSMFESLQGRVIHDHWPSYAKMEDLTHGYCHAHHLRELQAAIEQGESWAKKMVWYLLILEQFVHQAKQHDLANENRGSPQIADALWAKIQRIFDKIVDKGITYHEAKPPLPAGKRGRQKKRRGHNLALRLKQKKTDMLRFVIDWDIPFTNNQAERALRMMKLCMKIMGCFRSKEGAQEFVMLSGVIETAKKRGWDIIQTLLLSPEALAAKLKIV